MFNKSLQAKKIDNFYDFFREPWAYFIYHDRSEELFAMVKELLPKVCLSVCIGSININNFSLKQTPN